MSRRRRDLCESKPSLMKDRDANQLIECLNETAEEGNNVWYALERKGSCGPRRGGQFARRTRERKVGLTLMGQSPGP
jgi:hypothetical protein